jgi:hypothetical protein
MAFPPLPTDIWDITQPLDTQLASQGAADFRALKLDIMQRLSQLSGTFANLPTPEVVNATWGGVGFGLLYFSTDTAQIFQWNGVAWIDITPIFISKAVGSLNLVGQTANVVPTLLYAVPASGAGLYRISVAEVLTLAAGISSTLPEAFVAWTDLDTSLAPTARLTTPNNVNVLGTYAAPFNPLDPFVISVKAGTNITIGTIDYASAGAPVMQFSLRARAEFLG